MVVGIDVCKDAFNKGMVVVGFVASINLRITRYFYNDSNIFFYHVNIHCGLTEDYTARNGLYSLLIFKM